jgi:hypothetical protein
MNTEIVVASTKTTLSGAKVVCRRGTAGGESHSPSCWRRPSCEIAPWETPLAQGHRADSGAASARDVITRATVFPDVSRDTRARRSGIAKGV